MEQWKLESSDKYHIQYEYYEKKHSRELVAMIDNLDTYFKTLLRGIKPLQISAGFIHHEPNGIKAIDQKGGGQKAKLQQARLYVYRDEVAKTLFLLTIGDKHTQRDDIKWCREYVLKNIRKS